MTTPGDYIGAGDHRLFHPGNGAVTVAGDKRELFISASGGTFGEAFELRFAAPRGQDLHPGLYLRAQRYPFQEAGRPGLDVNGDSRGCNRVSGYFDIKDIAFAEDGKLERLWLVFEHHCEATVSAMVGEVQIAVPAPARAPFVAPQVPTWPGLDLGSPGIVFPVALVHGGSSPISLVHARVVGRHARDFPIRLDECTGTTLFRGDSCEVFVRFRPRAAGPRLARLVLVTASGRRFSAQLAGYGIGGRTRLLIESEAGDPIGRGRRFAYTPRNAVIALGGTRTVVGAGVVGADARWWEVQFAAPPGDILAPGTYAGARRYPINNTAPGLDFSGMGRGCNELTGSFTVTTMRVGQDGSVSSFGTRFTQYCDDSRSPLRGVLEFRVPVGDVSPPQKVRGVTTRREEGRAVVSWRNPRSADFAYTIVRFLRAGWPPGSPTSGLLAYQGRGRTTSVSAPRTGPVTFALFPVDRAGNVGRPVVVVA